jgi:hypothetical protein
VSWGQGLKFELLAMEKLIINLLTCKKVLNSRPDPIVCVFAIFN